MATGNVNEKEILINETDSNLLKGIKLSFNNALSNLSTIWRPSVFAKAFPQLAKKNGPQLEAIRKICLENLMEELRKDLIEIIDNDLTDPINALDSLIMNSYSTSRTTKAWRPSGNPEEDLLAHDYKVLKQEKEYLKSTLEPMEKRNADLFKHVKAQREECLKNYRTIEIQIRKCDELQEASELLRNSMTEVIEKHSFV